MLPSFDEGIKEVMTSMKEKQLKDDFMLVT